MNVCSVEKRRSLRWAPLLLAALLPAGCVTMESIAPSVTPAAASSARTTVAMLEQGRVIYTTDCTDCHNAVAVTAHTRAEWPDIIRRMAPESKLTPAEERAVLAYVMAYSK